MWNLNKRFAELGEEYFSYVKPSGLQQNNRLLHKNDRLLNLLNLTDITNDDLVDIISGNKGVDNYSSLSTIYMGHQFGVMVPKLGDGRAILIAEHIDKLANIWELQLKGAGKTPYSRMGDGRAVLRSSIREYLASHAMRSLDVATTEAIGIIVSDDVVYRETPEQASVVLRAAHSFLRFGHFEYFAHQNKFLELKKLTDFTIAHYFPCVEIGSDNYVAKFLQEVVRLTATTIAKWQAIGFVHGVMNTDNMSILGLTIDYGPYAFIDNFSPKHIYNHSDSEGRYVYANQPHIAWWNLYRLAEALLALDGTTQEYFQPILDSFAEHYNSEYLSLMWRKLGIANCGEVEDKELLEDIIKQLEINNIDWTYFWRKFSYGDSGIKEIQLAYPDFDIIPYYKRLTKCYNYLGIEEDEYKMIMLSTNPAIVLRSHLLHDAINKAKSGNFSEVDTLFKLVATPYHEVDGFEYYYQRPPSWAQYLELSCSS